MIIFTTAQDRPEVNEDPTVSQDLPPARRVHTHIEQGHAM